MQFDHVPTKKINLINDEYKGITHEIICFNMSTMGKANSWGNPKLHWKGNENLWKQNGTCGKISCSSSAPKLEHEKMHIQWTLNVSLKINGEKVWCCKQFKMVS
jgi:hypothetical protein